MKAIHGFYPVGFLFEWYATFAAGGVDPRRAVNMAVALRNRLNDDEG